jgi:hypothetical protein
MDSLYNFTLILHSWNRWIILIAGLLTIIFAIGGITNKSDYTKRDRITSLVFISSLHLQLLIGILLYFVLSPITLQALSDFGAAMKENTIRYWAVEHSLVNIIAIAIAQIGSITVKRKQTSRAKFKSTLIWNLIALLLILAMIPMGMMGVDRPWFRI